MTRLLRVYPIALAVAAASACAPASPAAALTPSRTPDCSFRSGSTCWTLAGRFPARRPGVWDTMPERRLGQPPPVLAASDSIHRHPDPPDLTESR
jgi:hypothetical protein